MAQVDWPLLIMQPMKHLISVVLCFLYSLVLQQVPLKPSTSPSSTCLDLPRDSC